MAKISWISMVAGAGIGAACAVTVARRMGQTTQKPKESENSHLQRLTTDFLQEDNREDLYY